jgi:hypothetical protein
MHGDSAYNIQTLSGYLSGTGAVTTSLAADGGRLFSATVNPGSTATGSARAIPVFAVNAWSTAAPARKLAFVMSYIAQAISLSSAGVDELHWRLTIQAPVFGASTSLQTDEIAFVMDDRNTLGQGATGSNLRAMCRLNGTTLDWVDTGIAVASTSAFLIVAWEPNGPGVREGRARIVSAGDFGTSLTTHVDRLATLSGAVSQLQPCVTVAKTLGTGNRSVARRFMRAVTLRTSTASGGIIS